MRSQQGGWLTSDRPTKRLVISTLLLLLAGGIPAAAQSNSPASSCVLSAGSNRQPNEGFTDYILHLRPSGKLQAVMVFVDFSDAPQSESTEALYTSLVPNSVRWFEEVSYGRMSLEVRAVHKWYRMPKISNTYGFGWKRPALTFEGHRSYIADAITLSDKDVDYSQYQILFVVASNGAALPESPAFHAYPGRGILVDGTEIRHASTFGNDVRDPGRNRGSHILIHELGHLIGLPDIHDWQSFGLLNRKHSGGWDVMSSNNTGAHFFAWHKWKLGWLDPNQIRCVLGSFETIEETITPLETRGGLKAVVIPVSASRAYVVEVRQKIGFDTDLCDSGVLIYSVDASARNGTGPIRVSSLNGGKDFDKIKNCDVLYDAPFDVGPAEIATFDDADANLTIEVVSRSESSYKVRIRRQNPASP